jgi:nitrate reductase gamma subunit
MQFGKFHGWAFMALGVLLVLVQVGLFFVRGRDASTAIEAPAPHKVSMLPGVAGGLALIVGLGLYVAHRKKPQE